MKEVSLLLNHVAILVRSVERAAAVLARNGLCVAPKEEWDGEGTAEIYVGEKDQSAKLLLMEPIKPGAYARAMATRGPGLHHVAVDVADLEAYLTGLAGSGWYLLPASLGTIRKASTAWLARPGTRMLIEVQQRQSQAGAPAFLSRLEVPLTVKERGMISALGVDQVQPSEDGRSWLVMAAQRVALEALL